MSFNIVFSMYKRGNVINTISKVMADVCVCVCVVITIIIIIIIIITT